MRRLRPVRAAASSIRRSTQRGTRQSPPADEADAHPEAMQVVSAPGQQLSAMTVSKKRTSSWGRRQFSVEKRKP